MVEKTPSLFAFKDLSLMNTSAFGDVLPFTIIVADGTVLWFVGEVRVSVNS